MVEESAWRPVRQAFSMRLPVTELALDHTMNAHGTIDGDALLRAAVFGLLVGHEHGVGDHQPREAALHLTDAGVTLEATLGLGADMATWTLSSAWARPGEGRGTWRIDLSVLREALRVERDPEGRVIREVGEVQLWEEGAQLLIETPRGPQVIGIAAQVGAIAPGREDGWRVPATQVGQLIAHAGTCAPATGVLIAPVNGDEVIVGSVGLGGASLQRGPSPTTDLPAAGVTVAPRGVQVADFAARTSAAAWQLLAKRGQAAGDRMAKETLLTLWWARDPEGAAIALREALWQRWEQQHPDLAMHSGLAHAIATVKALAGEYGERAFEQLATEVPALEDAVIAEVIAETAPELSPAGCAAVGRLVVAARTGMEPSGLLGRVLWGTMTAGATDTPQLLTDRVLGALPRAAQLAERAVKDLPVDAPAWQAVDITPHAAPTVRSVVAASGLAPEAPIPVLRIDTAGTFTADTAWPGGARLRVLSAAPMPAVDHPLARSLRSILLPGTNATWTGRVPAADLVRLFDRAQAHRTFAAEWQRDPLTGHAMGPVVLLHRWGGPSGGASPWRDAVPLLTADAVWLGRNADDVALPFPPSGVASAHEAGVLEGTVLHPAHGIVVRSLVRQMRPVEATVGSPVLALDAVTAQEFVQMLRETGGGVSVQVAPGAVRLETDDGLTLVLPGVGRLLLPPGAQAAASQLGVEDVSPEHAWTTAVRHLRTGIRRGVFDGAMSEGAGSPEARSISARHVAEAAHAGLTQRLDRWTEVPARMPSRRAAAATASVFASGGSVTLPFPSSFRAINRGLRPVMQAADAFLIALDNQGDLFGDVSGDSLPVLWGRLAEAAAHGRTLLQQGLSLYGPSDAVAPEPPRPAPRGARA